MTSSFFGGVRSIETLYSQGVGQGSKNVLFLSYSHLVATAALSPRATNSP